VEDHLDLDTIWHLAHRADPLAASVSARGDGSVPEITIPQSPRIGYIKDSAFWFYYPENLEQLRLLGAELLEVNAIEAQELPDLDALYIGGGFPETQAEGLARNSLFRNDLKGRIGQGLPVYAECGGFMYLGQNILVDDKTYPMVGALPVDLVLEKKPQGHGYTILEVTGKNPYFPVNENLKGHEFHYSRPVATGSEEIHPVFKVLRGRGMDGQRDGLCKKNLLATYTHLHAAGNRLWAKSLFKAACRYGAGKK
jgi:cobyrinic acid a,c-diamide synthase